MREMGQDIAVEPTEAQASSTTTSLQWKKVGWYPRNAKTDRAATKMVAARRWLSPHGNRLPRRAISARHAEGKIAGRPMKVSGQFWGFFLGQFDGPHWCPGGGRMLRESFDPLKQVNCRRSAPVPVCLEPSERVAVRHRRSTRPPGAKRRAPRERD